MSKYYLEYFRLLHQNARRMCFSRVKTQQNHNLWYKRKLIILKRTINNYDKEFQINGNIDIKFDFSITLDPPFSTFYLLLSPDYV